MFFKALRPINSSTLPMLVMAWAEIFTDYMESDLICTINLLHSVKVF